MVARGLPLAPAFESLAMNRVLAKIPKAIRSPDWAVLVLPSMGWLFWFLLIPFAIVLGYSFLTKGTYGGVSFQFTVENYVRAMDFIYLRIFWNSLSLAFFTAFSCLVLGYPMAYVMATAGPRFRNLLLVLVILPFWINLVVRAYAIKVLFAHEGFINQVLIGMKLLQTPIIFEGTRGAVWFGMVTNYLPFMILPIYVALEKFDFSLLEAAKDLGAGRGAIVKKVLLPLTQHGIMTGFILVFTPALGEFVIPDMFGGAKVMLLGNLITEQFLKTRDWPFGSALSVLLIAPILALLIVESFLGKGAKKSEARGAAL